MKNWLKITLSIVAIIAALILLGFGTGYLGVGYTKTVGKAQRNADREVYQQSESYVLGKRQDLGRYYHEWALAKTPEDKKIIESVVRQQFAEVDENIITDPTQYSFLQRCKNN